MTPRLVRALTIAAVLAQTGCEAEMDQVRAKAAESFKCAPDSVTVKKLREQKDDSTLYEARGCDESARFVCETTHDQVAGRDRGGARGNMRNTTTCHEQSNGTPSRGSDEP